MLPFAGRSMLLVDDDLRLLESTRDLLEFQGFTIQTARNFQEAQKRLAESTFDLLLTDLRLDEGCGLEILKAAQGLQPDCCRLAMSGYATARLEVLALEAGAHQVLHKPLDDQFLTSTFDVLLRGRRTVQGDRQETCLSHCGPLHSARWTPRSPLVEPVAGLGRVARCERCSS